MTNKRESGEGPGMFEAQEPCLSVSAGEDGSLSFSSDLAHAEAPQRAFRLVQLLKWFPVAVVPAEHVTPARTERLTLADVALHLWSMSHDLGETPIEQQDDRQFRKYLAQLGMLPGWFRGPAFLRVEALVGFAKAQANMLRGFDLAGYDEEAVIRRLKRAGLTERMVARDVPFDELRRPTFPVRVEAGSPDPRQQADLDYLRDALAGVEGMISLADVEQLLLDRKRSESGWFRQYIN